MFGIGGFELFIILIFGFLIFGPEKLPDIALTIGKGIARFREAQADMNETIGNEKLFDPNNPDEPFKDPIEALDKLAARQEERMRAKESGGSAKAAAGSKSAVGPKTTTPKAHATKANSTAPAGKQESAVEGSTGKADADVGTAEENEAKFHEKVAESGASENSDAAAANHGATEGAAASEPPARQESFTERKARYERERAARKAAEADAEKVAAKVGAAEAAPVAGPSASEGLSPSAESADAASLAQAASAEGGER